MQEIDLNSKLVDRHAYMMHNNVYENYIAY